MNGRRIAIRRNDVVDDVASTGMQIYDSIWAVPSIAFDRTLKTSLSAKDALKKKLKLNPWGDESDARQDLLRNAQTSRNAIELGRIYKYAKARKDSEIADAVEKRAKDLGIWDKVKGGDPGWGFGFNPAVSRLVRRHVTSRKRSNPESGAARFYKKFHGKDSEEEIVVENEIHEHEYLGVIGVLVAVVVDTPVGGRATIRFDGSTSEQAPWLCSSEDGCQLYIEGGCQELDLKKLEMDGPEWYKERMVIGCFAPPEPWRKWNLSYLTEKSFDALETIEYQHDLGEPDEDEPKSHRRADAYLEYDTRNKLLFITGGQYHVELPLIGVSPGIEN